MLHGLYWFFVSSAAGCAVVVVANLLPLLSKRSQPSFSIQHDAVPRYFWSHHGSRFLL